MKGNEKLKSVAIQLRIGMHKPESLQSHSSLIASAIRHLADSRGACG